MSGPAFFASLRRGYGPILATIAILIAGAIVAVVVGRLLGLGSGAIAGSFAGALTNTPTIAYAVYYVFGVLGPLLACSLVLRRRARDTDVPPPLVSRSIEVETSAEPGIGGPERRCPIAPRQRRHRGRPGGPRGPGDAGAWPCRSGTPRRQPRRGDVDVLAQDGFVLQPGDRLRIIAPGEQIPAVTAFLGDSERGLLLGHVVFPLPGMSLTLGPAAGTLLVALVFGKVARIGPFLTTMPHTAGQTMADFGLLGVAITVTVSYGLAVVLRRYFGMGRTRVSGVLAGAHTQPAVLAFANGRTGCDSRVAQGYALVYPAALIAKILIAKVLGALWPSTPRRRSNICCGMDSLIAAADRVARYAP